MYYISTDYKSSGAGQLILTDSKGPHIFYLHKIIRMEASDNYTIIYFNDRPPFIVSKVLKVYEEMLRPYGFIRTHRSHLVNRNFIKGVVQHNVIMQDASVAEMTKRKKPRLMKQLFA